MSDPNAIFQNAYYIGNNFNTILYGVELVLYFASVGLILQNRRGGTGGKRSDRLFLSLSTGLLAMITIYVAVQSVFGEEMWIVNADYPGGSGQYLADNAAVWYQTLGSAASIVLNLMSDGLLMYRTFVVWSDWRVIVFPGILYLASAALGILTCYVSGTPNSDFFLGKAADIALSYSTVVIGLNVTCSALICGRILFVARRMEATLGRDVSRTYTGAASLIIESMLPYTLFGIAYVVTLGLNSPYSIFFLSVYVMFTCVSPQMIILRVLMGRGWTREAADSSVGSARFVSGPSTSAGASTTRFTYRSEGTGIALKSIATSSSPDFGGDSKV
ncbi:uncharacterized protein TRAVEDRAFT_53114 [Trametes versicolor FP-101664 SS1]|uniref:uncharacterized protein n=1 Tax=Trametes versicolor (strain FP-101664) TaxID=717944 RepID=UPI0004621C29|nr:uncharacterized protein TRAVEDRAFT_53114 [Trametes versicolor FP-101664 SS1]EIW52672.1 hypothetical protein TRAVEDRAFT_53114 [Trametes versicolor FP-101664 SS1]